MKKSYHVVAFVFQGHLCIRLGYSVVDKYVAFIDKNAYLIIINVCVFKVNDTIYVSFNISFGIHISKHSCNTHRLKANLLFLDLYCTSINKSTESKYTHHMTMNVYNSTVDVF